MRIPRLIPIIQIVNQDMVKTVQFKDPSYIGDPINAVKIFNEKEVDELIVQDIFASKENREPNYALIEELAGECFMPLAYGGGIHSIEQAQHIFSLGVEKICVQSKALQCPKFVKELADIFGSQSIIVSLDAKKDWLSRSRPYWSLADKFLSKSLKELLTEFVDLGAGEILLNSVNRDGSLSGPDLELISTAAAEIDIPLIALGGVSSLMDIRAAVDAGANAVAAGSFFSFYGPHRAVLITYPVYTDLQELFG